MKQYFTKTGIELKAINGGTDTVDIELPYAEMVYPKPDWTPPVVEKALEVPRKLKSVFSVGSWLKYEVYE